MKDYNNFKNWKTPHSTLMQDLTFSTPDDVFIYTSFKMTSPFDIEENQVLFAESFEEAAGYFRHIFLYDLLVDATDDLELDPKLLNKEHQEDAIKILSFWFKVGKALNNKNSKKEVLKLCDEFNCHFSISKDMQYEFHILNGANELKRFLKSKYKNNANFDNKRLENICSEDLFAGKLLNDFLNELFTREANN